MLQYVSPSSTLAAHTHVHTLSVGTDARKLVHDGYPAGRVLACDLRPSYITLGHALFADSPATCPICFFASDIFALPDSPPSSPPLRSTPPNIDPATVTDLAQLRGALTHIYTGALFHLFNEPTQRALACRLALLLSRAPGAVIFGRHQGLERAGTIDDHLGRCVSAFLSPIQNAN